MSPRSVMRPEGFSPLKTWSKLHWVDFGERKYVVDILFGLTIGNMMKKNHNQKPKTFLIKNINLFKNYFESKKVFPFLTSTDLPNKKANGVYVPNSRLAPEFASYRSCCFEKN